MDVLVIEQNIGVACTIAENVAIMVNGRVNRILVARELAADRELQQRLLGVGRHGHEDIPENGTAPEALARGRSGCGARSHAHLHVEPEAADTLVAAGPGRADRGAGPHQLRWPRSGRDSVVAESARSQTTGASLTWSSPARSTPRATSCV